MEPSTLSADPEILKRVPQELVDVMRAGSLRFGGGLHIRGACTEPWWHSLRAAWEGPDAFHELYPAVQRGDIPFAEDCLGDQFLLRDGVVLRLSTETGTVEECASSFGEFLRRVDADPMGTLQMEPLLQLQNEGGCLLPGQLLSAMPPFCVAESGRGVDLRPVSTRDRRSFLAHFARQIEDLPEGAKVQFVVEPSSKGRLTKGSSGRGTA